MSEELKKSFEKCVFMGAMQSDTGNRRGEVWFHKGESDKDRNFLLRVSVEDGLLESLNVLDVIKKWTEELNV